MPGVQSFLQGGPSQAELIGNILDDTNVALLCRCQGIMKLFEVFQSLPPGSTPLNNIRAFTNTLDTGVLA